MKAVTLGASIAAAQRIVQRLTSNVMSARVGLKRPVPLDPSFLLRNGIDKSIEYQRPYRVAAQSFTQGMSRSDAIEAGVKRLNSLAAVDIQMTKLRQSQLVLDTAGIMFYRRRVTGDNPCSLCEIAATKIYATNELMPIHTHCSCEVDPIDLESGKSLRQLQSEADRSAVMPSRNGQQKKLIGGLLDEGAPVRELRDLVMVREHGEIGPMLTWKHQHWAGPDEIAKIKSIEAQAFKAAHDDGGITISLEGAQPDGGFAFAPLKTTEFHTPLSELTIDDIDRYIDENIDLLSEPGNHLGLWVEDGEAYIDVSQVGPADASTIERAQAADQLGVFDLSEFNTINVGVIQDGRYVKLGEAADLHSEYRRKVSGANQSGGAGGVSEISTGAGESTAVGSAPIGYEEGIEVPEADWVEDELSEPVFSPGSDWIAEPEDVWGDFATLTDMHWQHVEFDDFKEDVRQGVRRALEKGYEGLETEADWVGIDMNDVNAMRMGSEDMFWATSSELFDLEGQELAARAVHSEPVKGSLFRGMGMRGEHIDTLEVGDQLSLPASSFGFQESDAEEWAMGETFWKSKDFEGEPVIIEVLPGAKTAAISDSFVRESVRERVAFGRFEIVDVKYYEAYPQYAVEGTKPRVVTRITVQHKSLREFPAATGIPGTGPSLDGTSEYTIIKKPVAPKQVSAEYPYEAAAQLLSENPQLQMVQFHDTNDPAIANDIANTIDSLLEKYPQSKLTRVTTNRVVADNRYAEVDVWQDGLATERSMTKTQMSFNKTNMTSAEALERRYSRDIDKKYHPPKDGRTAAEAVATHEFAHTLDAAGSYRATERVSRTLKEAFLATDPDMRDWPKFRVKPLYDKWLEEQLSGYSRRGGTGLNPTEALAEAFTAVELDPENATDAEKALHRLLIDVSTLPERSDLNAPGWNNFETPAVKKEVTAAKEVAAQEKKRRKEGVTEGGEKHKSLVQKSKEIAKEAVSDGKEVVKEVVDKYNAKKNKLVMSLRPKVDGKYAKIIPAEELSVNVARYNLEDVSAIAPTVLDDSGKPDWAATWAQLPPITVDPVTGDLSDPIIEANFARVLERGMANPLFLQRGKEWYPVEFGDFVRRELETMNWINPYTGKPFTSFEEAMDAASAYAINAGWPQTMADFHNWMRSNPPNGKNTQSADKASVGGGTYWLDNAEKKKRGYKIKDFAENGKGNRETSTTDRHMSRIGLGTNDSDYAGGMLGATNAGSYVDPKTGKTVQLPGYERLSQAIDRVSRRYGLYPDQGQATMWIEFFGIEAAHGLPPDEIIAKGLAGINEWVIEQGREWAKSERRKLGIDESIFDLVLPDARGNLIERSPLARYPKEMRAAVLAEMEAVGKKKPVAPQSDSVVKTKPVEAQPQPDKPKKILYRGLKTTLPPEIQEAVRSAEPDAYNRVLSFVSNPTEEQRKFLSDRNLRAAGDSGLGIHWTKHEYFASMAANQFGHGDHVVSVAAEWTGKGVYRGKDRKELIGTQAGGTRHEGEVLMNPKRVATELNPVSIDVVIDKKTYTLTKPQESKPVGSEPMPPDPLLDLLDGKPAKTPTEEILDMLGVTNTPPKPVAPEPKPDPIPGVPAGQERWYLHLKEQEDRASTAHLTLPTGSVNRYREYDRTPTETKVLKKAIAEDGVRLPLWISTDGEQALLVEGNHRLAVAKDLGIEELPIRVTYNKEVLRNEGRDPAPLTGPLKEWVQAHLEELKRGELS